jgi:dTDP-4-amino-4,6-dideoxygalactose transaminase
LSQKALAHLEIDPEDFPNCRRACQEVLSLPLFASMKSEQIDTVLDAVRTFYS